MAITEGVGIVSAGKEARAKALTRAKQVQSDKKIAAEYKVDPMDKVLRDLDRAYERLRGQESTGAEKNTGRGMGDTFDPSKDFRVDRGGFFSPDGGAFDERNNVEVASADVGSLRVGDSFTEQAKSNLDDTKVASAIQPLSEAGSDAYRQEVKQYEQSIRDSHIPGHIDRFGTDDFGNLTEEGQKKLEGSYETYRDFRYQTEPIKYRQGTDFSKKEEKPSLGTRIANLAGSVVGAVTGTKAAQASEAPTTVPSGSFGISKEGRDQAAINRGIKAAEATGIPSGANLKAGSFGISEAGRKQAAANRADAKKKASKVSTTTKQGKPRTAAQMSAAKRIASGTKPKSAKERA